MEDDFSDSDTNSSILESFKTPDFTFTNKLPDDKKLYKKDKTCICCKTPFGMGITREKKHFCKFCYRGICAKCSPSVAFHPEDKKLLRICNLCCEKTVEDRFSEIFQVKISEARDEKTRYNNELNKYKKELQELYEENYKTETFLALEKEKIEDLERKFSYIPDLIQSKSEVEKALRVLLVNSNKEKVELGVKDREIRELTGVYQELIKEKSGNKSEISNLRNKLAELQDDFTHGQGKRRTKSSGIILSDLEQKEQQELNTFAIKNFELEVGLKNNEEEIEKVILENEVIGKRIKVTKEEMLRPDKLVNNERNLYSIDEEEKIRNLRSKQRSNQATIEKLRLDIRLANNQSKDTELRGEDEKEYEDDDNAMLAATRPCARCCLF